VSFCGVSFKIKYDFLLFLLLATGDFYCSGNDLSNFTKGISDPVKMAADSKELLKFVYCLFHCLIACRRFVAAFIDHPKPLVALVHAPVVGIAVTTLALCDVVYAADKVVVLLSILLLFFVGDISHTVHRIGSIARRMFIVSVSTLDGHSKGALPFLCLFVCEFLLITLMCATRNTDDVRESCFPHCAVIQLRMIQNDSEN
jgi:hypothetical protein